VVFLPPGKGKKKFLNKIKNEVRFVFVRVSICQVVIILRIPESIMSNFRLVGVVACRNKNFL
jgi:hypothetical protein